MNFFTAYMEFKALLSGEVDYEALASSSNQRNQLSNDSGPSRPHDHTRYKHRQENRATAQETLEVLPDLLEELGTEDKAEAKS